jgi:aldehyde oxidoreductase
MKFTLNGQLVEFSGDPETPLLTYLRDEAGILSAKDGCAPQAACGACTVQLDDKAVLGCVTKMERVEGKAVITTEGLGEYRQEVFANSFVNCGGVQCGYCIPGIVMQSNALISKNPEPSRDDIEKALTPNLCRCTGYKKIVDAVEMAAEAIRKEEEVKLPQTNGRVGTFQPKYQATKLVLGQHHYTDDIRLPGMKVGALKFSDHPRATVLKIDTSAAEKMDGVIRIFTAQDVPGDRQIGLIKQDWPLMIAEGETTRYVGDVLALVVAETDAQARNAVAEIKVDYDVLEPLTDMHKALLPDAPLIHPQGNKLSRSYTSRGDMAAAEARSAFIAQGIFETQMIEHGFMEPECTVARPLDDGVEVFSSGQGIFDDRIQIAKVLGLPLQKVRVVLVPNGGGFGGKEDLTTQGHAALAAYLMQVPVKVRLTRDESIVMHPKRHPIWMDYKIGCDANGLLTFVKVRFVGDTGAYASVGMKVLERSAGHATGAYNVPVTDVEASLSTRTTCPAARCAALA